MYSYRFIDLPISWRSQGSSIYFPQSALNSTAPIRIVIEVTDSNGIVFRETLNLAFSGSTF